MGFRDNAQEVIKLQIQLKTMRRQKKDLKKEIQAIKQKIKKLGGDVDDEYDE